MKSRFKCIKANLKSDHLSSLGSTRRLVRILLVILLIQCWGLNSFASDQQQITVTGTVTNVQKAPMVGVSVSVKGTTSGSFTDIAGHFSVSNVSPSSTLIFSFVGMTTQEVSLNGRIKIDVVMEEDAIGLEEVVVIGYGTARKSDITGSLSSVSNEKLVETATFNPAQALQGKASGVVIQQTSAEPGADPRIMIRGNRSLSATNEPLYVVDGIPLVSGFSDMSQSNIESIEILKDASATAIYGSRGANGVILVTTKSGKSGKPVIEYNSYYGIQEPAKIVELMDGPEWIEEVREAYRTNGAYPAVPTYAMDLTLMPVAQDNDPTGIRYKLENAYDTDGSWNPERLESTDWIDAILRTGSIMNHDFSVRGGTDNLKAYAAVNYFDQTGLVKVQDYSRYSIRLNFDWNLSKKVTLGGQTLYTHIDANDGPNLFDQARSISPLANMYNEAGDLVTRPGNETNYWNPVYDITETDFENRKNRFLGSYYLEIKLPFDFKYRSNFGLDYSQTYDFAFYGTNSTDRRGGLPRTTSSSSTSTMYTWDNLLYWDKKIQDHSIGLTFLQSIQQNTTERSYIGVQDLAYATQLWYNVGSAPTISGVSSSFTKWQLASFMGRLNYSLKDRYLITASARYDGSSRLAPGHKWVLFPSVALAWRVTEEDFMQNITALNNLKLRIGYGVTGNSAIAPYTTAGNLAYGRYNYADKLVMAFYQNEMPNPDLSWEKTRQWNGGIDFGLLKSRISGALDFYLQNTFDLLMSRQLPNVSGFSSVVYNIGKTRNKGIELTLNTVNIKKQNFEWTTDFIFARNKEEIVELFGGKEDDTGNRWFIGQPISVFYDYNFLGIWQLDEAEEAAKFGTSSKPGTIKVLDKNGDYKITATDREIIGTTRPKFVASLSNNFKYKIFDFSFFLNSTYGNMLSYVTPDLAGRYNTIKVNYWKVTEYDATGAPIASNGSNEAPRPNASEGTAAYVSSTGYYDASFIRLSNVTLGCNLPNKIINRVGITKFRIYLGMQNAFCLTNFPGTDPESGSGYNVPNPRTTLLGLNLSF